MSKIDNDNNTYHEFFECMNCGERQGFFIEKGVTKEAFIKIQKCNVCGCKTLEPVRSL